MAEDFKSKNFLVLASFFALVIIGLIFASVAGEIPEAGSAVGVLQIGDSLFLAELAETQNQQARGLAGREALTESAGMLFSFNEPKVHRFWMKDVLIPLDIIWILENKVIGFVENVQPEANPPYTIYSPPIVIDTVFEASAGVVQKNNIKIGDPVILN